MRTNASLRREVARLSGKLAGVERHAAYQQEAYRNQLREAVHDAAMWRSDFEAVFDEVDVLRQRLDACRSECLHLMTELRAGGEETE